MTYRNKRFVSLCLTLLLWSSLSGCGSGGGSNSEASEIVTTADSEVVSITASRLERIIADPFRPAIYISDSAHNAVHVIDTSTNTLAVTIPVGSQPTKMDLDRNAQYLFVMNSGGSTISVISTQTRSVVETINLSDTPDSISVSSSDYLYVSMRNGASPAIVGYNVATMPPAASYSNNASLIIMGRTSDHSVFYMHDWSTTLDTTLWDVTGASPVTLGSGDVSSGTTTITPRSGTNLVFVSPAFEYWNARYPNDDGDVPIIQGLTRTATLNVDWTVAAVAENQAGTEIAITHNDTVTNATVPIESKHDRMPDLHVFNSSSLTGIARLPLSDYVLHNGLAYAANGDLYFLKGKNTSLAVSVVDR